MTDMYTYVRFLLGLIFVIGLIYGLSWVARRMNLIPGAIKLAQSDKRRLAIVESSAVDAKRRLVLVRRDNVEHLLLLGPTSETVIETGIQAPEQNSNMQGSEDKTNKNNPAPKGTGPTGKDV